MTRCLHWTDFVLNVLYLVSLIPHFSWTASVRKPRGNVNPQDGCMMAGIDLLRGTKELRKLRATFDLDSVC